MIITNSNVTLGSTNYSSKYSYVKTSVTGRVADSGGNSANLSFYRNLLDQSSKIAMAESGTGTNSLSAQISIRLQLLHRILAAILGSRDLDGNDYSALLGTNAAYGGYTAGTYGIEGSLWEQTTETEAVYRETEGTTFTSRGVAETADGRTISFGVDLTMSREFTSIMDTYKTRQYFISDPLIINVDSSVTEISEVKFLFDIDCDGEKEEISRTGAGSGFLALDKNGDGEINDGSELFGAASGDGFSELSEYDVDGNNWIDENDDIYSRLRVWTMDEDGNERLLDLKETGVGAIYLGSTGTQFSFTDSSGYANGFLRTSGIYLHEDGRAGTLGQVDLTTGSTEA